MSMREGNDFLYESWMHGSYGPWCPRKFLKLTHLLFQYKDQIPGTDIPIIKVRQSWGNLIIMIGMPMLIWSHTPDNKVQGAIMGPTWVLSAPDGPHESYYQGSLCWDGSQGLYIKMDPSFLLQFDGGPWWDLKDYSSDSSKCHVIRYFLVWFSWLIYKLISP